MTDGEVAVRQNGQEHAVSTPGLDGQILAAIDGEQPVVHVPPEIGVVYHDESDDLAADGYGDRTEIEMRGFSLPETAAKGAMLVGGALLVASGSLFASSLNPGASFLAALVGGSMLTYIGARSAFTDRTTGSDRNR